MARLLSIIIPTYNRKKVLIKCLDALFNQTYPSEKYEIVIVNDGSTDGTKRAVQEMLSHAPVKMNYFEQTNKGPAAARNLGIKNALGSIVLIIGDDIVGSSGFLQEHMFSHERCPQENFAVLGHVTWSPEIKVTAFMKWLENGGPQFGFNSIKGDVADFRHFYTCNISLKKGFLIENGLFDEEFPYAAYEDIELGYRLQKKGLQLRYNKNAVAYHHHPGISLVTHKNRMSIVGESEVIFSKKHPGLRLLYGNYRKASKEPRPSYLWVFLYEMMHYLGMVRFVEGITWRAKQYYLQDMAEGFVEGYEKKKSELNK